MSDLSLDQFFFIGSFSHKDLWQEGKPIWHPLTVLDQYLKTHSLGNIEIDIPEGVTLVNRELISIGKGTVLEAGVMIRGPCILGEQCNIRHAALLREGVICGNRCSIGHCAEIKQSILLDEAVVTHFCYVGNSIIGNRVNVGAGVKCANLRLDRKEVFVVVNQEKIFTGLSKMGAVLGDGVQIGCNAVLNPGVLIGRDSVCYPLLNFSGYAPPRSQIHGSAKGVVHWADPTELLEQMRK